MRQKATVYYVDLNDTDGSDSIKINGDTLSIQQNSSDSVLQLTQHYNIFINPFLCASIL